MAAGSFFSGAASSLPNTVTDNKAGTSSNTPANPLADSQATTTAEEKGGNGEADDDATSPATTAAVIHWHLLNVRSAGFDLSSISSPVSPDTPLAAGPLPAPPVRPPSFARNDFFNGGDSSVVPTQTTAAAAAAAVAVSSARSTCTMKTKNREAGRGPGKPLSQKKRQPEIKKTSNQEQEQEREHKKNMN
jgi:hypothetical protein